MNLKIYNDCYLPEYVIKDVYLINEIEENIFEEILNLIVDNLINNEDVIDKNLNSLYFILKIICINNIKNNEIIERELINIGIKSNYSKIISKFILLKIDSIKKSFKKNILLINEIQENNIEIYPIENEINYIEFNNKDFIISNKLINKFDNLFKNLN